MPRKIGLTLAGVVLGVLLAVGWWWLDDARVLVRLELYQAPSGQEYEGERGHKVVLARIDNHLGGVQGYEVWLGDGVDSDTPYGHVVDIPSGWVTEGLRVEWRADGVALVFTDGGEIFVPAEHFTGGR
ncbi:hypothetical protein [Actinophytocola algeriensis]|jgi:hypothetical protein|uniref:Uncharacterized protein n=1 Tax=Actinophytocola algeriensis TaxID=1768010 RepID=A0A7W7VFB0_9PSEU|nr:hypothetical protein [Actinophytocola algeriensis]MBB4908116.1 hypothetical protein [Actinophytocola algeriensis]MBE1480146.1 hypothetical protein [Actinophytocola algeriensis]